jgi:hypothetical protein
MVIPVSYEGKQITIAKDWAKNKSSHRTLPLVPVFQELLLRLLYYATLPDSTTEA